MSKKGRSRWVLLRDLTIFQIKLLLDGVKDVVLAPLSLGAAAVDIVFPGSRPGHRFYAVMRLGEYYDQWLSLYAAADKATTLDDGLFGQSRAGSPSFLGRLEATVIGEEEEDPAPSESTD